MSDSRLLEDSNLLFAHLPGDGSSIGNGALRDLLGWGEKRYLAARQPLIEAGRVVTGKGRGGSVRRAAVTSHAGEATPAAARGVSCPSAAKTRAAGKRASETPELSLEETAAAPAGPPAPRRKTAAKTPAPAKTLEVQLWDAADKMRGAVPPTDYMHVCLGLDLEDAAIRTVVLQAEALAAEVTQRPVQ